MVSTAVTEGAERPAELPARFCLFLLDGVGDMGEVVALDVDGYEIGRASFT
jgi:hypothetical protein